MLLPFLSLQTYGKTSEVTKQWNEEITDEFFLHFTFKKGHYLTKRSRSCFKVKADAYFNFHVESILHLLQSTTQYNYQLNYIKTIFNKYIKERKYTK